MHSDTALDNVVKLDFFPAFHAPTQRRSAFAIHLNNVSEIGSILSKPMQYWRTSKGACVRGKKNEPRLDWDKRLYDDETFAVYGEPSSFYRVMQTRVAITRAQETQKRIMAHYRRGGKEVQLARMLH